jgi:hypothetical protein
VTEDIGMKIRVKFGKNPYNNRFTCGHCRKPFERGGFFLRLEHGGQVVDIPVCPRCFESGDLLEGMIDLSAGKPFQLQHIKLIQGKLLRLFIRFIRCQAASLRCFIAARHGVKTVYFSATIKDVLFHSLRDGQALRMAIRLLSWRPVARISGWKICAGWPT